MTKTRVLVLLLSVVLWPIRADAWWGWFEEFSGPGPYNDFSVSAPTLCFNPRRLPIASISDDGTKITTSGKHGLKDNQVIEIGGTDISFLNGTHVITVIDDTTFSIPPNATNPILMKAVAPSRGFVSVVGDSHPYLCGTLFGSERDPHLSRMLEVRVDRLWTYPDRPRFSDVPCPNKKCADGEGVRGWRVNALFLARVQPWLDLGFGAGILSLSGDAWTREGPNAPSGSSFSLVRLTANPVEVVFAPVVFFRGSTERVGRWDRVIKVRFDETLIPGFDFADLGGTSATKSNYSSAASLVGGFTIDIDVMSALRH